MVDTNKSLQNYLDSIGASIESTLTSFERLSEYEYKNVYTINVYTYRGWYTKRITFVYDTNMIPQYVNYALTAIDVMKCINFDEIGIHYAFSDNEIDIIKDLIGR